MRRIPGIFDEPAATAASGRGKTSARNRDRSPAGRGPVVPPRWRREIGSVLIGEEAIARRLKEMSRQIERDFGGRDLAIVSVLSGTVMFLADLVRNLSLPLRLDFIGVSSYRRGTEPGDVVFTKELGLDVRGRDVLVVDDILDTGRTLSRVLRKLKRLRPRRIKTCVLLNKEARRTERVRADYIGFEISDVFVVGYGLDFAERYRNLPFVGVLHPRVHGAPNPSGAWRAAEARNGSQR